MATPDLLAALSLGSLSHRCAQESDHFFHRRSHDPRYCFELFRRAIVDRDERAWALLCAQYRPLLVGWVRRHPAFRDSGEEVDYFVNGALAKMWSAVTPQKFADFDNLKSLLRYLQLCVASVLTDHVRTAAFHQRLEDLPPRLEEDGDVDVEGRALQQAARQEFWEAVNQRLNDEKERLVVHYSYVVGYKPAELYERQKEQFADVREIYRIKENVLSRLRRDEALQQLLSQGA